MDQELTDLMKENNKILRTLTISVRQLVDLAVEYIKSQQYEIEEK